MNGTLYESIFEDCHIMDKTTRPDGRGGVDTVYVPGAKISVAFSFDDSNPIVIANQETVTDLYTLVTYKRVVLMTGDIIRRDKDGTTFKIESDSNDNATPSSSALDMRQVKAKKWSLPHG